MAHPQCGEAKNSHNICKAAEFDSAKPLFSGFAHEVMVTAIKMRQPRSGLGNQARVPPGQSLEEKALSTKNTKDTNEQKTGEIILEN